jgi:hypothetical protein
LFELGRNYRLCTGAASAGKSGTTERGPRFSGGALVLMFSLFRSRGTVALEGAGPVLGGHDVFGVRLTFVLDAGDRMFRGFGRVRVGRFEHLAHLLVGPDVFFSFHEL